MPKRKLQFNETLRQKYPGFRKERIDFEAECIMCRCICTVLTEKWKESYDFVDNEH